MRQYTSTTDFIHFPVLFLKGKIDMQSIIEEASAYATEILETLPSNLTFHNFAHTKQVVNATLEIGPKLNLSENQLEVIQLAAWFHDTGYSRAYHGHEEESVAIVDRFLRTQKYPEYKANFVRTCILATKIPQNPRNILEEVLCDADLYHFSAENYIDISYLLLSEWKNVLDKTYSDTEWNVLNCYLLKEHSYFTNYGKTILQIGKEKNIYKMHCSFD